MGTPFDVFHSSRQGRLRFLRKKVLSSFVIRTPSFQVAGTVCAWHTTRPVNFCTMKTKVNRFITIKLKTKTHTLDMSRHTRLEYSDNRFTETTDYKINRRAINANYFTGVKDSAEFEREILSIGELAHCHKCTRKFDRISNVRCDNSESKICDYFFLVCMKCKKYAYEHFRKLKIVKIGKIKFKVRLIQRFCKHDNVIYKEDRDIELDDTIKQPEYKSTGLKTLQRDPESILLKMESLSPSSLASTLESSPNLAANIRKRRFSETKSHLDAV